MTLSKRGDYVVRSALCLARSYGSGGYRKIREVVAEVDVPQTFASQILADLVHEAGHLEGRQGRRVPSRPGTSVDQPSRCHRGRRRAAPRRAMCARGRPLPLGSGLPPRRDVGSRHRSAARHARQDEPRDPRCPRRGDRGRHLVRFAVEGTGSYGAGVDTHKDVHVAVAVDQDGRLVGRQQVKTAGLSRYLAQRGIQVTEVRGPSRQLRHDRGKSDTVDAEAAARSALAGTATTVPKSGND
jgi:hypothetical protein